jgi:cysteine synthase
MDILKAVGAEVIVCPTNVEPEDPRSYYSVARRLAKEIPNSFHANQYDNLANRLAHYETTGLRSGTKQMVRSHILFVLQELVVPSQVQQCF